MTKSGKPLWGNSKNAYFRRVLRSENGVGAAATQRLLRRLDEEVVQVRLREPAAENAPRAEVDVRDEAVVPDETAQPSFDPFTPNVIVVVRTGGRDRALDALARIDRIEHLRLLAREQQLSVAAGIGTLPELRRAIVAAAERRIANRRAAAS